MLKTWRLKRYICSKRRLTLNYKALRHRKLFFYIGWLITLDSVSYSYICLFIKKEVFISETYIYIYIYIYIKLSAHIVSRLRDVCSELFSVGAKFLGLFVIILQFDFWTDFSTLTHKNVTSQMVLRSPVRPFAWSSFLECRPTRDSFLSARIFTCFLFSWFKVTGQLACSDFMSSSYGSTDISAGESRTSAGWKPLPSNC
jgi:hypothetical protein